MSELLLALLAHIFVLAVLGWCLYVGLCIVVQAIAGRAADEPEDDDEGWTGADDPCDEWDRARDRQLDADLWPVVA